MLVNEFSPYKGGCFTIWKRYTISGKSYMIHTLYENVLIKQWANMLILKALSVL